MNTVYSGELQLAGWSVTHNGGAKVTFWLPDDDAVKSFSALTMRKGRHAGQVLAAVIAEVDEAEQEEQQHEAEQQASDKAGEYGSYYQSLYKVGWWHNPKLWPVMGSDREYLDWLKTKTCRFCGAFPPNDPAHVRRIEYGAGVGIKPDYSAITLCRDCHENHSQHGEAHAFGSRDWMEQQLAKQRPEWLKERLHAAFNVDSMSKVDPRLFVMWAKANDLFETLPAMIRAAA